MTTTLWLGNVNGFRAVTQPDLPMSVRQSGFSDGFGFENGGRAQVQSAASAKVFEFGFNIRPIADFDFLRQLKQGSRGTGLISFADPEAFETNLFAAHWAEPGLIEQGWPSIYDTAPTGYANVSANSYSQPLRKATFAITQAANTAPSRPCAQMLIPIPPTMTLHLGVSGAATGTAVVRATGYNVAAGSSAGSNLTLLTDTSATRLNASFAGSSYDYVIVDLRRTSSATSTITLTSMLAQLWPTGVTPTLTGNHRNGDGHTGLRMVGWDESYRVSGAHGLRFSLVEVGAWLR